MKKLIALVLSVALMVTLCACAPQAQPSAPQGEVKTQQSTQPSEKLDLEKAQSGATSADTEYSQEFAGQKVVLLTRLSNYDSWDKIPEIVKEKTGIELETVTATVEYSDYVTQITSSLSAGDSSYDIIDVDELLGKTFQAAGYLEPINSIAEQVGDNFLGSWMEGISKGDDGNYYMIPMAFGAIYLYVNDEMFQEKGLSYPTTLDEMIETGKALTDEANGVYGLGAAWMQGGYLFNDIVRNIYAFDGDFYDWNNENTKAAVQFMYDQVHTNKITPEAAISEDYSQANQKFADDKYAMLYMWNNAYEAIKDDFGTKYKIVPIPTYNSAKTIFNSWGMAINKNSENKDAASEVMKVLASDEAQVCLLGCENAANLNVLASPEAIEVAPYNEATAEYSKAGVLYPRPMSPSVNEIQTVMETNVSSYLSGDISLDECSANVMAGIADLV